MVAYSLVVALLVLVSAAEGATLVWDNSTGSSDWGNKHNWNPKDRPQAGDALIFDDTYVGTAQTIDVSGGGGPSPRAAGSLTFDASFGYTLNNDTIGLNAGTSMTQSGAGAVTINSDLRLDTNATWTGGGTGIVTVDGSIGDGAGYYSFTKTGDFSLVLGGANTFDGAFVVNDGSVTLRSSTAMGASGTYGNSVASGASLALENNITVVEGDLKLAGTGQAGAGALINNSGNNTFTGTIDTEANTTIGLAGGSLTLSGSLALDHQLTLAGPGNATLSGQMYGADSLYKTGAGTVTISGTQSVSFSGGTTVDQGTLVLSRSASINTFNSNFTVGNNTDAAGSATLRLGAGEQIANHLAVTINRSGVFNLNNQNETINRVTMTGGSVATGTGTLTLGISGAAVTTNASADTASLSGNLNLTGYQPVFAVADGAATVDLDVTAAINAADGFQKTGAGTMRVSGAITTGTSTTNDRIRISGGTLLLGASNIIGDNAPIRLDGGTLATGGYSEVAGSLTLAADSSIDFGSGSSVLSFASGSYSSGILVIDNWSGSLSGGGADQLRFSSALGSGFLSSIQFTGYSGAAQINFGSYWEIVPTGILIPEPAPVVCAAGLLLAALTARRPGRRRLPV